MSGTIEMRKTRDNEVNTLTNLIHVLEGLESEARSLWMCLSNVCDDVTGEYKAYTFEVDKAVRAAGLVHGTIFKAIGDIKNELLKAEKGEPLPLKS